MRTSATSGDKNMNIAGIIAEYNPFHNGHAYHIQCVRKEADASYVIALISGNFVQRGAPACADKYVRARMALECGADLVLELPVCAAISSAETFARCGVSLFAHSGVVTHLGFGCESDSPEQLTALANLFSNEPEKFQLLLAAELKKGLSFPAARAAAARDYLNDPDAVSVLDSPNNILGIEYLKAIRQLQAPLIPCMVLRRGAAYHEKELTPEYSSATAIRDTLRQLQNIHAEVLFSKQHSVNNGSSVLEMPALDGQVPEAALPPFLDWLKKYGAVTPNDFSQLLHYKLLQDFSGQKDLLPQSFSMKGSCTVPSDLDNRTRKSLEQYVSFTQFTELLKTRDRTYTAVSRYLLSHLLDIDCRQHQALQDLDYAPYLHVLGMRREASPLLKTLRQHSDIPILTRLATEEKNLNPSQQLLLSTDIQAAHIYNSVLTARTGQSIKNEYRHPLVYC